MSTRAKIIIGYLGIGLIFTIYFAVFGNAPSQGFGVALGKGLVWPAVLFPGIGTFIGAVVMILVVVAISLS